MNEGVSPERAKDELLDAILPHVVFDGWSESAFRAAIRDTGTDPDLARACCPRGAHDLAAAFHKRGDRVLEEWVEANGAPGGRYRDRIMGLERKRIELIGDREAARRAAAHFALPHNAAEGARLIWETADLIWRLLGDTSDDINWYSKRATLAAVHSATFLYWLGDESPGNAATWDFLDRRIEDVMRFEKVKAKLRESPLAKPFLQGPVAAILSHIHAPRSTPAADLPGYWQEMEKNE